MYIEDTIAAIATAPGESGIGIVRISGSGSLDIANKIFDPKIANRKLSDNVRKLIYGTIRDGEKQIDEVLISYMKAPHSFTGEDVVEINCHGGYIAVKKILYLVLKNGARPAERGEFTKRAFLSGRIDLSQAEAVIDVIKAKTDISMEMAQKQLSGHLSQKVKSIRDKITMSLAKITVAIDFPEEDEPEVTYEELASTVREVKLEIDHLLHSFDRGKILRDGLKTVIIGKPNVGKSSLLNAILRESRAIVTDIAGTTRDVIEEYVNIGGIPLKIVDTAGIRDTEDIVEKIGVERSVASMESADLCILVLDSSEELSEEDRDILSKIKDKKVIVLLNKTDLPAVIKEQMIREYVGDQPIISISAKQNIGIEKLEREIEKMIDEGELEAENEVTLSNLRHKNALEKAASSCEDALTGLSDNLPLDILETDFRDIWDDLGLITGESVSEDLLDTIFREFCIGK